jgi:hypothetical protein
MKRERKGKKVHKVGAGSPAGKTPVTGWQATVKTPRGYITALKAAAKLNVSRTSIMNWFRTGRLPGLIRYGSNGYEFIFIKGDALLRNVFKVKCLWCGKVFRSSHPRLAKYCCYKHKLRYLRRAAKKGDTSIRRFKKRR